MSSQVPASSALYQWNSLITCHLCSSSWATALHYAHLAVRIPFMVQQVKCIDSYLVLLHGLVQHLYHLAIKPRQKYQDRSNTCAISPAISRDMCKCSRPAGRDQIKGVARKPGDTTNMLACAPESVYPVSCRQNKTKKRRKGVSQRIQPRQEGRL